MKRLFIAALLILPIMTAPSKGQIDTGITGVGPRAVRIAVADLKFVAENPQTAQLTRIFNETLQRDLDFSGNLELASRSFFPLGNFSLPAEIKPEDWRATSAQYVVYGSLALNGNRFSALGFMRDLTTDTDPISRTPFAGSYDEEGARLAAHRFADRILEQLGFGKGIAQTQIAFVSSRTGQKEIYVMDYDGSNQRKLTSIRNIALAPNWSPVDDRIAYTAYRPDGSQPRVEILSASGERHAFEQATGFSNRIPSWSNDGKAIVYTSNRDGNSEIYWANADGSNRRRLSNHPGIDISPTINPATGRQIAFISNRSGTPQLYTMDSDGTNITRITEEGGDAENPAYSPDGKMIAFAWQKPRSNGFDIYLYNVGMRTFTQLTSDSGNDERPTWAPDGKHLAFVSNRTGESQIFAMTIDGKKVLQLTNAAGINEGPTWSGFTAR